MAIPKDLLREYSLGLDEWCILHGYRGSIAHGMFVPNSDPNSIDDKDTMSIIVPNLRYYFGLEVYCSKGTKEIKKDVWDIVIYEVKKFVSLLAKGNPNVMSLLWLDENMYIKKTKEGQLLIDNRDLFVGKHVYKSFSGYAYSQLRKMENLAFEGYMGEKRKSLVKKFGYDTKNAAHCIRLLKMAVEFLSDGYLQVKRHDAAQLLQIKHGEWSLDEVKNEAKRLFEMADKAYIESKLPLCTDRNKIDDLLIEIIKSRNPYV